MIRRLLVLLEDELSVEAALSVATSVAYLSHADLVGLYCSPTSSVAHISLPTAVLQNLTGQPITTTPSDPEEILETQQTAAVERTKLEALFTQASTRTTLRARFLAVEGDKTEQVIDRARSADFLVLGNTPETFRKPGTKAVDLRAITRNVASPILVVPANAVGESRIVVGYDGSTASERALRAAAELAEITDLKTLYLLSVGSDVPKLTRIQERALEYLSSFEFETQPRIAQGNADAAILALSQEVDASIVALGAYGSPRVEEAFFGSTTESVLRDVQAAVLLAH
jgi:nucleotide-binding universal stress UspA family protein